MSEYQSVLFMPEVLELTEYLPLTPTGQISQVHHS
jgi:hypothetical protein